MKKIFLALLLAVSIANPIPTNATAQQTDWCLSEILFQQKAAQDPSVRLNREQLDRATEQYVSQNQNQNQKSTSVIKIIPIVFHIIQEGGPENISDAQIMDQLDSLNKDYRRQNADTVNTPAPFKQLAADCEIEFRLAQLDPNGNCTNGITRHFSHLTNNARDNIKSFDYWPSNKYLNIWVVKSIENTNGAAGTIIGYAQFPGGNPLTDGVVLKYDWVGSIGAAAGNGGHGRTAPHEVGHWLNLRHVWGDATCGNDLVADTPVQNVNQSTCPAFPKIDTQCNNGPNGAMFSDYMDYTNGSCQNMFSAGQNLRMQACLGSSLSGRNNLWTSANLIATGTDGTPPSLCIPIADFNSEVKLICVGTTLNFTDASTNGVVTSWDWQFAGGSPPNSNSQNVSVQYNTPGTFDVSLTATNASGSNTKTATGMVVVSPANGLNNSYPFTESFESISVPGNDWFVLNDYGNAWQQTQLAAHTGINSVRIYNYPYTGTPTNIGSDDLISSSYDLSNVSNAMMTFWRAYAYRSSTATDVLKIFASTNCGSLWSLRYSKSGTALATAGLLSSNFVPTASQWAMDVVNLSTTFVSGHPNVRFKFEYTEDSGNNIYLDDINLNGTVGINELTDQSVKFEVYPNPAHAKAHVSFTLSEKNYVQLKLIDVIGREVRNLNAQNLDAGEYQFDIDGNVDNGVYYAVLSIGNNSTVKKLVLY